MSVRHAVCVILALFALIGCKSVALQQEPIVQVQYRDRLTERIDTLILRDSVRITERAKGDTILLTETRWRTEYRTKIQRDTLRDTIVIQLPPVIKEKELTALQSAQIQFGKWCVLVLVGVFGFWFLRKKIRLS